VIEPLEQAALDALGEWVEGWIQTAPKTDWAIAVNLLFSYVNPAHEAEIGAYLTQRFPNTPVSLSHKVSPIWREYERATTTITDAFIKHIIERFVDGLTDALKDMSVAAPLALMKSNGGHVQSATAGEIPVQLLLSGLAGGVIAGRRFARDHAGGNAVTLDMGGTSCDVGLINNGDFGSTTEYEIEWGVPVSSLFIDYTTIGAGGGSIAYVDSGGLLRVGPRSAGAEPGPACYGKGGLEPTVTDANVVLGRLDPKFFLGGEVSLDGAAAQIAVAALGKQIGLSPNETALAILGTAAENMADAIRLMTVDRGIDHRDFALIAFGGAGPLHAVDVAAHLGMEHVIVPPNPGLLSALGTLLTELRVDRARTVMHRSDQVDFNLLNEQLRELSDESIAELKRDGLEGEARITGYLNMRYLGQNFGEIVALDALRLDQVGFERALARLHRQHEALYGYAFEDKVVEITEVRMIGLGEEGAEITLSGVTEGTLEPNSFRTIHFADLGEIETPVHRRDQLAVGMRVSGPALVEETDSTTLIPPDGAIEVQADGSMMVDVPTLVERRDADGDLNVADDPVTLTVINNALKNICDEMASAMIRTAHSPIFSESRDFSCILFDRKLRMIGQAEMNPAIICAGLHTIPLCVEELGEDSFEPGDVIVHNDPYRGQCHMPEHMFMKPVFLDGKIIGYAANIAHIAEIGGMAVGSFASTATEIFQEGLRLPPVKIMSRGEYVKDVWRIVMANHRTPDTTWGDFHALLGSLTTAERRMQEVVGKLGLDLFEEITDNLIDHAEKWMRSEIKKLPNGVYKFEDYFEDDGVEDKRYYFRAAVHIREDDIVVDLSESDPQARGPINVSYVATAAAGSTAVLQSIGARDVPLNSGCFRPIKVVAPPGTVANPVFPAPCVAGNTEGQPRIISAVQGALAQAIPERISAAEGGTACNILIGGTHPDTGDYYTHYQLDGGGWGGRIGKDGNSAQCIAHGSTIRATPIEVFETRYPMRTVEYALRPDSGGAGKWRGGLGVRRLFEVTAPEVTVSALLDRTQEGPWGFDGGASGGPAGIFVRFAGTTEFKTFVEAFGTVSPTKFVNIRMQLGDQLLLNAPGGGGYGDPKERSEEQIEADLVDGFISIDGRDLYGRQ
jgi:N-methylhydantoinase B/oxoprolinase/acetone carboxylase alpha subunit/N-methylhydantoinase A/oxoprolinase/acetone carboxylase beta subunit